MGLSGFLATAALGFAQLTGAAGTAKARRSFAFPAGARAWRSAGAWSYTTSAAGWIQPGFGCSTSFLAQSFVFRIFHCLQNTPRRGYFPLRILSISGSACFALS